MPTPRFLLRTLVLASGLLSANHARAAEPPAEPPLSIASPSEWRLFFQGEGLILKNRRADNATGVRLGFSNPRYEFSGFGFEDTAGFRAGFDASYKPFVWQQLGWQLHGLVGLGILTDTNRSTAHAGLGFTKATVFNFDIRGDVRYLAAFGQKTAREDNQVRFGLGIAFPLGQRIKAYTDQDQDGVIDDKDTCPNTPLGSDIDGKGCVVEKIEPLADNDEDGIPDVYDDCANTPPKTTVDRRGCPPKIPAPVQEALGSEPIITIIEDSDFDGVPTRLDACPNTAAGLKVDSTGCVISQSLVLPQVTFVPGSDQLTDEAKATLETVITTLKTQPELKLEVSGHTDSLGPEGVNLRLSQKRAQSVMVYLVQGGIESMRLKTEGYGEFAPMADNKSEEGRRLNRRVEFRLQR
jgi:outer membrane protein OmpA-like peptidoglycan-associated protein